MFDLFQPTHLLFIFLVALMVFGPKRLVEMSRSLGRNLHEFKGYKDELKEGLLGVSDEDGHKEKRFENRQPEATDKQAKPNQAQERTEKKAQKE